jgi:hypothetical protein
VCSAESPRLKYFTFWRPGFAKWSAGWLLACRGDFKGSNDKIHLRQSLYLAVFYEYSAGCCGVYYITNVLVI